MPIIFKLSDVTPTEAFMPNSNNLGLSFIKKLKVYKDIGGELIQSSNVDQLCNSQYGNGFVGALLECYNKHNNVIIRPDDVWIAILTQFSRYVLANEAELRNKFVTFEGKKELVAIQIANLLTADFGLLANDLADNIFKNMIDPDMKDWIVPNFSTTTDTDRIVGSIIMMATMQKYFDYKVQLCCGIPEVTMLGTIEDWVDIKRRATELLKYDVKNNYMQKWYSMLEPILDNFIQSILGNPDFEWWNKICSHHGRGSGPRYISGWLTAFTVFTDDGKWQGDEFVPIEQSSESSAFWPKINTNDISCGYASVPLAIDDNGTPHNSTMVAGHIGHKINDKFTIQPRVDWFIALKKPEPESFMVKNKLVYYR